MTLIETSTPSPLPPPLQQLAVPERRRRAASVEVHRQTDAESCGIKCLDALTIWHGLSTTSAQPKMLDAGGTLTPYLGIAALARGFQATIRTADTEHLDPTWFRTPTKLLSCLEGASSVDDPKRSPIVKAYAEFCRAGGTLELLTFPFNLPTMIRNALRKSGPFITSINQTLLSGTARNDHANDPDPLGETVGHFVVVHGLSRRSGEDELHVHITDSWGVPRSPRHNGDDPRQCRPRYRLPLSTYAVLFGTSVLSRDGASLFLQRR